MAVDNETAWDYALGMIKVAGLEPTEEMRMILNKKKEYLIRFDRNSGQTSSRLSYIMKSVKVGWICA